MVNAYRPEKLEDALKILGKEHCTIFAGGTDLMVKNRQWSGLIPDFNTPVVFLDNIAGIGDIRRDGGILRIGAACTLSKIIENQCVPDYIKTVLEQMASPGIRNAATIGGNICNSSPAGDTLPLLYALDAALLLQNANGKREISVQDFIKGPGKNLLEKDEILTEISIPLMDFDVIEYRKVGTRKSTALSKLSFIGFAKADKYCISDIRLAFGAVGPKVVRERDMEKEIMKMSHDGVLDIPAVKDMYESIIKPIDDQRSTAKYRKETALRLLEDFIVNKILCSRVG